MMCRTISRPSRSVSSAQPYSVVAFILASAACLSSAEITPIPVALSNPAQYRLYGRFHGSEISSVELPVPQGMLGLHHLVYLGGALVEEGGAGITEEPLHRVFGRVAVGPVYL